MTAEAEPDYALLDRAGVARSMFHPRPDPAPPPPGATDHLIEVEPGVAVAARYYPLAPSQPTVLFFHGNGEVVGEHDNFAPLYHAAGLSLFVAEYRGYGKSGGRPSMAALVADAHAVAAYFHALLDAQQCSALRIVMGRSLGAQPALELAARDARFRGVIIESGAASIRRTLARVGLRGSEEGERLAAAHEAKVRAIRLPSLQLHGERDDLVPLAQAAELYDLLAETPRELVIIPRAGHNDILWRGQLPYFEAIRAFVARVRGAAADASSTAGRASRSRSRSTPGLEQLADGVYTYAIPGAIPVNAGIVVGADAVAVIDTGATEADARALMAAVARVTSVPVRYVINTHHHGEHTFGNWWFLPAVAVGHARCRLRLLGEQGATQRETLAVDLPMLRDDIRAVPLVPPALTFEHTCDVQLGGVSLRLAYLGRAHSDNDIVVSVEGAGLAFVGDVVEGSGLPHVEDGHPADWGATLRKLVATNAARFVPGHGRVVDAAFVEAQAHTFEALAATCAAAGAEASAFDALPQSVRAALGVQAPVAVRRYFEVVTGARA